MAKDKIKAYDKMLRKHIEKKHIIKLCRIFQGKEANIQGYLLSVSKHFLLMQIVYDFQADGYAIIPKDAFDSVRFNKFDKKITEILFAEGITDKAWGIDHAIDLDSWSSIFTSLQELDMHVIAECEDRKFPQFVIGPVITAGKKSADIQYYDAAGQLENGVTTVKYKGITSVTFDDRYSTIFRKYLKEPKAKKG